MPILAALIPAAIGAAQAIGGAIKTKKAERALEGMQTPKANQSIIDYYNEALNKYRVPATDTALYKQQMNNINRNVASAIGAGQDRRSGQGLVSNLVQRGNDASLNAVVNAENQREKRFATLGSATSAKAQTETKAADDAFNKKYNLLALKASGGNKDVSAGIQNIASGVQNYAMMGSGNSSGNKYANSIYKSGYGTSWNSLSNY